jgi:hypothetical protein
MALRFEMASYYPPDMLLLSGADYYSLKRGDFFMNSVSTSLLSVLVLTQAFETKNPVPGNPTGF